MKCQNCNGQMSSAEEASYRNRCETCWCLSCCSGESKDYRRICKVESASAYLRPSEYKLNKKRK